jgi:hypothetical protein
MDRSDPRALMALHPIPARPWWLAVLAAAACNHSMPFQPGSDSPDTPRDAGLPHLMTYSTDPDITPARAGSGDGWLYAYTVRTSAAVNRCVAGLPLEGGSRTRTYCDVTLGRPGGNSTVTWPAESPDGRLAYFRTRGLGAGSAQTSAALVLGSFDSRDSGRILRSLPYNAGPDVVRGITHLSWLDSHTLIFVATQTDYRITCNGCTSLDTLEGGLRIERLDIDQSGAAPDVMPGTALASSVQPTSDGSGFYFTLAADSRVYRRQLSTGATTTVYDFGAAGVARDVQLADSVLYAIVGGQVAPDTLTTIQVDHGGALMRVDLRTGARDSLPVPGMRLRHPSLRSTSHRILVESAIPSPDLWLVQTP